MVNQTNNDLSRDLGRVEGEIIGMKDDISDIKKLVERIDGRLAKIESRESQLRGAWWVVSAVAMLASSIVTFIMSRIWK